MFEPVEYCLQFLDTRVPSYVIDRSSIVFEVIRAILGQFIIFFYEKTSATQKRKSSKNNLQNKIKQTKNNKGNNFSGTRSSKRVKIVCFAFSCFFSAPKCFVKKNKQIQNCPNNLKYNTTEVYPL